MAKPIDANDFLSIVKESQPTQTNTPINAQNFAQALQTAPAEETMPWMDVPLHAITNFPKSATEFGKSLYHAVTNPLETASNVMDIAAGGLHNITPKHIANFIDAHDTNPEATKRAVDTANAIGKFYKDRYGSSEGFKQALASDPVGVAADVSSVLSGGSGILSKTSVLPKVARSLEIAADVTNPLVAPIKLTAKTVQPLLGLSTGTGAENIGRAAKAGFEGDTSFTQNLFGEVPMTQPLDDARHNLSVMRQNRSNEYRSGMHNIASDQSILDFKDVDDAIAKARSEVAYKGKVKDPVANAHLQNIEDAITDWKNSDPDVYHTPEGLDALKQKIGALNYGVPYEQKNASRVGGNVYNSIKDTISNQAPTYANVMADYSNASDSIQEIERALSLGDRSSADTALRKLQSLSRNNVNTNYGNRLNLAQQLEEEGGRPFINALSGQALSSPSARGMAGTVENATAIGGLVSNPWYLAALPFQTPRAVGAGLYYGGRSAKGISDVSGGIGLNPSRANTLADLLYVNQQNEQNKLSELGVE